MPDDSQLPHLGTFAKAAELSSFTAAARALELTQAAVSQRIQTLERALRVALFQRHGGRVLLSPAGKKLFDYAQRILALHREARCDLTGKSAPVTGDVIVSASSIPGEHLLPPLLANFHQEFPHIQVRVHISDSQAVLREIERGQAQLGWLGRRSDSPHLEFHPLSSDRLVIVIPWSHPWRRKKRIPAKQLRSQPIILRESGSGARWVLEQAVARTGQSLADWHIAAELGSNEAIKEAVLRGLGVAILSASAVQKELRGGQLRTLPVADLSLERPLFLVWDRRRVLPVAAQVFREFLMQRAA
jgi:DNA-binding transcriptional LysR family regulator